MSKQESIELLVRTRRGRLACEHEGQPYIVPVSFACDKNYLYAFTIEGKKLTWMRTNPRVCVEMEEFVTEADWMTVIVTGYFEELSDTPQHQSSRVTAFDLLHTKPTWWEPGYVETILDGTERPVSKPVYYRIRMDVITGHRGSPDKRTD